MSRAIRHLPYPELVDPRPGDRYRILDSEGRSTPGSVDKLRRRLWVPLGAAGRPVVRHELAHVLWSPPQLPRVEHPLAYLHAVEDARINLGLERVGRPVRPSELARAHLAWLARVDLEEGRGCDFAVRWVASLGTGTEPLFAAAAREAGAVGAFVAELALRVGGTLEARRRSDAPVAPFEAAREAAAELARRLQARGHLDPAFRRPALLPTGCHVSCAEDEEPGRGRRGADATGAGGSDGFGSGELRVVEAPLTALHPAARRLRPTWRAAVEGSRPGALHRWALDKAVFKRRIRRAGGTVLIDTSGSMCLRAGDDDALLEASRGAARVAIYSGSGEVGELRVVARDGRRAAREHLERFGGGNVVDAPALEWLARQPRPRLWVSDGGVSGIGDRSSAALRRRCANLCTHGRIRRLESAAAAARALAAGAIA